MKPPSECPACAPRRPAWGFPPALPVAAHTFHSATVPGLLASAASGSPAARRLSCLQSPDFLYSASLAARPATGSPFRRPLPSLLWDSRALHARFAVSDSAPSRRAIGASLLPSSVKASNIVAGSSAACRPSSPVGYSPLPSVWAFLTRVRTMPSADFYGTVRMNHFTLSHVL